MDKIIKEIVDSRKVKSRFHGMQIISVKKITSRTKRSTLLLLVNIF